MPAGAQPLLLDEVVAVVDLQEAGARRSILLSEVELEARLARARVQGASSLDEPLDDEALARALSGLVDRLVVVAEAERLEVFRLKPGEAEEVIRFYFQVVGREALESWLERTGVARRTVEEIVLREARVERYLAGRFRLAARPRPAQVLAAWKEQAPGQPLEAVRARLEGELEARRFEELVTQFVSDVRRRVRIRQLRDFTTGYDEALLHGSVRAPQRRGN